MNSVFSFVRKQVSAGGSGDRVVEPSRVLRSLQWLGGASLLLGLLALSCSSSENTPLPGDCTDTSKSLTNCGVCGRSCAAGQDCVSGQCVCTSGLSGCASGCVNLKEDAANCGACGASCGQGLVCSNGACASSCAAGLQSCGSSCVDLKTSSANCGACGVMCDAGQTCTAGVCLCSSGRTECNGTCVDTQQDSFNCGSCHNACPTGNECRNGSCQPATQGSGGMGMTLPPMNMGGMTGGSLGMGGAPNNGGSTSSGGSNSNFGGMAMNAAGSSGGSSPGGTTSMGGMPESGGSGGGAGGCGKSGFYVQDKKIYDNTCAEFVMRGVNYPYAWYSTRNLQQDFAAIAATGANAVRVVLSTGEFTNSDGSKWTRSSGSNLSSIISAAKAAKLVVIAEIHDTTGYGDPNQGAVALDRATAYWTSSEISSVLKGQEAFVIINIGNEAYGNNTSAQWAAGHTTAVQALRTAGFKHMLMVDAPNWGQDWENRMRNGGGASIWNADTEKNLVFSVHMYDVYNTAQLVSSYYTTYMSNYQAPLVVGEFAADHGTGKNVDEDTIMSYAEMLGVGYLGWSWSGNGGGLETLDITTNFNASSLTTWGNRLINGMNGIKSTAEVCGCY